MKGLQRCFVCIAALALVACANLSETREFAVTSAQISAYPELTQHWAATYERERRFLSGADLDLSKSEHQARQDVLPDLLAIHDTLALYFATLAKLAGEEGNPLGTAGTRSAKSLRQLQGLGLDASHVDAFNKLSALLVSGYQQFMITVYIRDADTPLQTLLAGMRQTIRVYQGTLRNELGRAGILLLTDDSAPQGKIIAALANAEYARLSADIERAQQRLAALDAALLRIADAHHRLAESSFDLSADESRALLRGVTRELADLRAKIATTER